MTIQDSIQQTKKEFNQKQNLVIFIKDQKLKNKQKLLPWWKKRLDISKFLSRIQNPIKKVLKTITTNKNIWMLLVVLLMDWIFIFYLNNKLSSQQPFCPLIKFYWKIYSRVPIIRNGQLHWIIWLFRIIDKILMLCNRIIRI